MIPLVTALPFQVKSSHVGNLSPSGPRRSGLCSEWAGVQQWPGWGSLAKKEPSRRLGSAFILAVAVTEFVD